MAVLFLPAGEGFPGPGLVERVQLGGGPALQLGAQGGIGPGVGKGKALGHCADIQPRTPHQKGGAAPGADGIDGVIGPPLKVCHGIALVGVHHVQHVVRHPHPLRLRHLPGAQIQPTVHLPGVGGDDLPVKTAGQLHPQPAFAAGGGPQDHDQFRQGHAPTFFPQNDPLRYHSSIKPARRQEAAGPVCQTKGESHRKPPRGDHGVLSCTVAEVPNRALTPSTLR